MKTSILCLALLGMTLLVDAKKKLRYIDPENPGHRVNPHKIATPVIKT